ncbi:small hydrophobic protein [Streptomyces sp. NPDC047097]|uniref:small hydrophobic protein n=1 Tax=Streptomyces sp. NPDC047097 TaxID=3155260 RepID=UPI0033C6E2B2
MNGFGHVSRSRRSPRSRGRTRSRSGPDRATLGIVGLVCAIAGFFVLGIILGPVAVVCGWLGMGRRWANDNLPALVAFVLGVIVTVMALISLTGGATLGGGL